MSAFRMRIRCVREVYNVPCTGKVFAWIYTSMTTSLTCRFIPFASGLAYSAEVLHANWVSQRQLANSGCVGACLIAGGPSSNGRASFSQMNVAWGSAATGAFLCGGEMASAVILIVSRPEALLGNPSCFGAVSVVMEYPYY
jgi:hypothetical protein